MTWASLIIQVTKCDSVCVCACESEREREKESERERERERERWDKIIYICIWCLLINIWKYHWTSSFLDHRTRSFLYHRTSSPVLECFSGTCKYFNYNNHIFQASQPSLWLSLQMALSQFWKVHVLYTTNKDFLTAFRLNEFSHPFQDVHFLWIENAHQVTVVAEVPDWVRETDCNIFHNTAVFNESF